MIKLKIQFIALMQWSMDFYLLFHAWPYLHPTPLFIISIDHKTNGVEKGHKYSSYINGCMSIYWVIWCLNMIGDAEINAEIIKEIDNWI